jgi:hypothetical protein
MLNAVPQIGMARFHSMAIAGMESLLAGKLGKITGKQRAKLEVDIRVARAALASSKK